MQKYNDRLADILGRYSKVLRKDVYGPALTELDTLEQSLIKEQAQKAKIAETELTSLVADVKSIHDVRNRMTNRMSSIELRTTKRK